MRPRLRVILWTATIAYWSFSFVMTHLPPGPPPPIPVSDRVAHAVTYAMIAGLLSLALASGGLSRTRTLVTVVAVCLAYGVADELLQIPVGRSAEVGDWLADAVGTIIAAGAVWLARAILPVVTSGPGPAGGPATAPAQTAGTGEPSAR
jgi:VanZ family protein